jgi:hypothetical protein
MYVFCGLLKGTHIVGESMKLFDCGNPLEHMNYCQAMDSPSLSPVTMIAHPVDHRGTLNTLDRYYNQELINMIPPDTK